MESLHLESLLLKSLPICVESLSRTSHSVRPSAPNHRCAGSLSQLAQALSLIQSGRVLCLGRQSTRLFFGEVRRVLKDHTLQLRFVDGELNNLADELSITPTGEILNSPILLGRKFRNKFQFHLYGGKFLK